MGEPRARGGLRRLADAGWPSRTRGPLLPAGLEAPGEDPDPAEQALGEGAIQAGLEALDRWEPAGEEDERALRELDRLVDELLDDSGFPYPPGLADQALRVAWHAGRYREAWLYGAAGWLRATALGDAAAASLLESRLTELVLPAWHGREDPVVGLLEEDWRRAMRTWQGADDADTASPLGDSHRNRDRVN